LEAHGPAPIKQIHINVFNISGPDKPLMEINGLENINTKKTSNKEINMEERKEREENNWGNQADIPLNGS